MPNSVAPIKAVTCNKARQPFGCRQCAGHKGREDHKEEGKGLRPLFCLKNLD